MRYAAHLSHTFAQSQIQNCCCLRMRVFLRPHWINQQRVLAEKNRSHDRPIVRSYAVKALANEDTLLRTHCCPHKCFPVCPRAQYLLQTQILCPRHKKCFWFCSETFCVRKKCFSLGAAWKQNIHFVSRAFARSRNIMSNRLSTTMCPRLPGP